MDARESRARLSASEFDPVRAHRTELLLGWAGDRRTFPDRPNDELTAPEILNAILNWVS